MTDPQYESIEAQMFHMRAVLERVAMDECEFLEFPEDKEVPCYCSPCRAVAALRHSTEWRYEGAMNYRVHNGHNPRETRIVMAWKKAIDDHRLSQILDERRESEHPARPSARDWYVATSVVQWLATNVGMSVLEAAGFKYTKWDEDRESREDKS